MIRKAFSSLLLFIALCFSAEAKIYLVSVGVSDYPGTGNDLRLPHNDAATMQWLYRENKQAATVLLMNEKATVSNVRSAMQKMYSRATADDIIVLFFSGHGVKGSFVCYDGFLRHSDVRKAFSASRSKNKMIFADACFSGSMRNGDKYSPADYGEFHSGNIMLFLSCRSNEFSIEEKGMTNGFFTYALQHGLRGGADKDKNRIITAKELFRYVSAKVIEKSRNRQHPVMWGKFPDSMPVMRW